MDESGDLGFDFQKGKTSRHFVITFIFTKDKKTLEKLVRKVFKGFSKKDLKKHTGTLHAYKETPKTRLKLLTLFHGKRCADVITIYLNKKKVYTRLQDEKNVLYNYVTNILLDRVCTKKLLPLDEKIRVVASRRDTNKFLNMNFEAYLKQQVKNKHKIDIDIEIRTPNQEKGLQVADMVSWAIFRKYEHSDDTYYNQIKSEIIEENPLFS